MRLSEIATHVGGTVEGDGTLEIRRIASLETAGPGDLTFLGSPKLAAVAAASKASAIFLSRKAAPVAATAVRVDDPYLAFAEALDLLYPAPRPAAPGIHPTAVVAPGARIAPGAAIGPYVVIAGDVEIGRNACFGPHVVIHAGCRIGDDVTLHSRVTLREGTRIGHRVIVHDGSVLGADGFGFTKRKDGTHRKIPQVGIVVIEDDVEIQASCCIDRATLGETRIGRGTKIDNLVQVGHNCVVGPDTILCAQVGLSGTSIIGRGVTLAGQVGAGGHLTVGDGATAIAQSGIAGDVEAGHVVGGSPAIEAREWMRAAPVFRRLPELAHEVRELRKRLEALEGSDSPGPEATPAD